MPIGRDHARGEAPMQPFAAVLRPVAVVWMATVAIAATFRAFGPPPPGVGWTAVSILQQLLGPAALLLAWSAFFGGAAIDHRQGWSWRRSVLVFGVIAVIGHLVGAWLLPMLDQAVAVMRGTTRPLGVRTPVSLLHLWREVSSRPDGLATRFSVTDPSLLPQNWVAYLLASTVTIPASAILFGLLGQQCGRYARPLLPRRQVLSLWGGWLAAGSLYVLALVLSNVIVRADPSVPGWLSALMPLMVLGAIVPAVRRVTSSEANPSAD